MSLHKFKVGDIVAINPTISRFVPGGSSKLSSSFQAATSLNITSRALMNRISASHEKASLSGLSDACVQVTGQRLAGTAKATLKERRSFSDPNPPQSRASQPARSGFST
jgi:hypothetical protein